jgi:hypothetical protein
MPSHIERRSSLAIIEKIIYVCFIFVFACAVAGQFDLEGKPANVDFDVIPPFLVF